MGALHSGWLVFVLVLVQGTFGGERELIQTGWDSPTPADFRAGIAEFEKLDFFDGAAVVPTRRYGEKQVITSSAFLTNHWEWNDFADCVRDLEATHPQRCTNNFLMLLASPGNVSWFDDAGWNEVVDHWRLLARVARQGRMAGIIFDAEPYSKPWSQFSYAAQTDKGSHTFAEMAAKARERGRGVMKAVGEEYPNMTVLAYRLFSDLPHAGDPHRPVMNLESSPYGLMAAFVNGWCDALPPEITIVDGNESAYGYENEEEYAAAFARLKLEAPRYVSVPNRAKIRQQFSVSHGIYLDAYSPAPGGKAWFDFKDQSPGNRLMTFVAAALDASDGPVWVYGETGRWWPKGTNAAWSAKFPGVENALRAAKDPTAFAALYIRDAKPAANLLRDAKFAQGAKAWFAWQAANTKGKSALANNVAQLSGMENGSVSQIVPVKPGETYVVGARAKTTGRGDVGISIGWQKAPGKWVATSKRVEFSATEPPGADGWQSIVGLVHVPPDAANLSFLFFARKQDPNSEATFKDPVLIRVSM
jgi:hypothetical protein